MELHKLLVRQLKSTIQLGPMGTIPSAWKEMIQAINDAYHQADADRLLLERSLELSSQELLQANFEMRAIFQAFPDIFFRIHEDGTILDVRGGQTASFFDPGKNLVGTKFQQIPIKALASKFQNGIEHVKITKSALSIEYPLQRQGFDYYYEARLVPLPHCEIVIIIRDITERKRAEQELIERSMELEKTLKELRETQDRNVRQEKLAAIGELASGVAHELRNPLAGIRNATFYIKDALKDSEVLKQDPSLLEFLDLTDENTLSANRIIGDLLDYSKVLKLYIKNVSLNEVIDRSIQAVKFPQNVKMKKKFNHELPNIDMDPQRMKQVFVNLINNAIQAMPEGGEFSILTRDDLKTKGDKKMFAAEFTDTGLGIKEEDLKKVFQPLYTTKKTGTGLGLTICQGIVNQHGGFIACKSKYEKGTTFTVYLPIKKI